MVRLAGQIDGAELTGQPQAGLGGGALHAMMPEINQDREPQMLDDLLRRMQSYRPLTSPIADSLPQAAVLLPITRSAEPGLVLTLRASGMSTHSGEVAFPGGRRDPEDLDLMATALREAQEEIGLPSGLVEVLGPLSTLVSRHGIEVTPYVGLVPDYVEYQANDAEIASVFTVPLAFFRDDPREMTHRIDYLGKSWYVPSYRYGEYQIWGLTAIMVVELVNLLYDADIALDRPSAAFTHLR
jgi:8-oxo-dGTP pyrophosphatase MutT (NUDIX family)